ncbi:MULTISPECIES: carbon-nitrogen hydrolase family protein [Arthrobacter]|uniref:Carbon-nitrogen hydrolase family protein n=2 Tax=Arthrobacter TaxID=1663 RepID=A0ABU9KMD4_9MICC|nr:carbon-nitrogen hydrolase family protein [Arthrobacter sp. YJM1]MDP5227909.1 carbon-nitrogen hydrolase family protein [Arthrobacter sp. YJM1]
MRVALAQILSGSDPQGNLELIRHHTAQAAAAGARLVVFPEASMCAFGNPLGPVAEPLDGAWAEEVRTIARDNGVTVVAGMFNPGDGSATHGGRSRVRNTLLVTGPEVETSYTKIHLYDAFGFAESDTVEPGATPVTFTVEGITFGLATCYDVRFPALFTANALAGAQAHIVCASWGPGPGKVEHWELLTRARALDTTSYVLAAGQADPAALGIENPKNLPTGVGHSGVVGPLGTDVIRADGAVQLLVAELDPEVVAQARATLPVLANRVDL